MHIHDPRTRACDQCAWYPDLAEGVLILLANFDALNAAVAGAVAKIADLTSQVAVLVAAEAANANDQASADAAAAALDAAVTPAPVAVEAPVVDPNAPVSV